MLLNGKVLGSNPHNDPPRNKQGAEFSECLLFAWRHPVTFECFDLDWATAEGIIHLHKVLVVNHLDDDDDDHTLAAST